MLVDAIGLLPDELAVFHGGLVEEVLSDKIVGVPGPLEVRDVDLVECLVGEPGAELGCLFLPELGESAAELASEDSLDVLLCLTVPGDPELEGVVHGKYIAMT